MNPEVEARERRSLHRSPSYPCFGLAEAIEKVRAVYDHDKRSAVPVESREQRFRIQVHS